MIARNDPCWCGSGKKWKKCHHPLLPPQNFETTKAEYFKRYEIILKTPEQIEGIRAAGNLAATILKKVCAKAKKGVTTEELNAYAMELHKEAGAKPAPLGYGHPPFPKGICTSLNEVICHGIPNDLPLEEGDIMNIDVTSILNGYYGDCSAMVTIGNISEEKQKVVDVSYECLMRAIKILKPGVLVSEIGQVIEDYASGEGCSVVNQFVAHGVGVDFHEAPQIPHCYNSTDIPLAAGMTFTIEPMINAGVREGKIDPKDHWTARTLDGKASAQWEHTLLITDEGYEILTLP
ncbi:MAG: methionyl aminopeptidase [Chlamydiales bacterium]|nr:methionyl aminopeptidase [Chlamydiales bacterium]